MLRKRGKHAVALLESDAEGNLTVQVKAHEQTPADREDLVGSIAHALDVRLGGAPERARDDWRHWKQKARTLEMCVEMFAHNVAKCVGGLLVRLPANGEGGATPLARGRGQLLWLLSDVGRGEAGS